MLMKNGHPMIYAERCLNHLEENEVKRTYQWYSYHNEMKEAWKLLEEQIELSILQAASKVITADFRMNR